MPTNTEKRPSAWQQMELTVTEGRSATLEIVCSASSRSSVVGSGSPGLNGSTRSSRAASSAP